MVKLIFLLRRQPHLSREDFQRYWRERHAPLVAARAEALGVRYYVQRHTVDEPASARMAAARGGVADFDGIAELWWERSRTLDAAGREAAIRAGQELLDDERNFIDLPASPVFFVEDHEVIPHRAASTR